MVKQSLIHPRRSKHWGASLLTIGLALAAMPQTVAANQIGVAAIAKPTTSAEAGAEKRIIEVGANVIANERIVTSEIGQAQLLFNDGTNLSLGPNSDVVLDKFVYDPAKGSGEMAISVAKGALRLVGGKLSKENPVQVKVGTATMGIRGGIASFTVTPGTGGGQPVMRAHFQFGSRMTITNNGVTQTTSRPGTSIDLPPGGPPSSPRLTTIGELNQMNANFQAVRQALGGPGGPGGGPGGPPQGGPGGPPPGAPGGPPLGGPGGPPLGGPGGPLPPGGIEAVFGQSGLSGANSGAPPGFVVPLPPPGGSGPQFGPPVAGPLPFPLPPLPPGPPPDIDIFSAFGDVAGHFFRKQGANEPINAGGITEAALGVSINATNNAEATNFQTNQTSATDVSLQATVPGGVIDTPIGANTGAFNFTGVTTIFGTLDAKGYTVSNRDFTFVNLQDQITPSDGIVLYGGRATLAPFLPPVGIGAHTMAGGKDPVPFFGDIIPGGAAVLAQRVISPLYSAYAPTLTPADRLLFDDRATWAQISLGISGQGAAQTSFFGGATGSYVADPATFGIAMLGGQIGTYRDGAGNRTNRGSGDLASGPSGMNGSAVYGLTADYMVLTPDSLTLDGVLDTVTRNPQASFQQPHATLTVSDTYSIDFAVRQGVPGSVAAAPRSLLADNGYAAALIERRNSGGTFIADLQLTNASDDPLSVTLDTDPMFNRLAVNFTLADGGSTYDLNFGGFDDESSERSAFINDKVYAARESLDVGTPSQHNGSNVVISALLGTSSLANVTNSVLPSGVNFCTCEYLNWGWWVADIRHTAGDPNQRDRVHLGSFATGTLPAAASVFALTGSATYNGHAMGNVNNNGNRYVAVGNFNMNWDFGTRTGTAAISNFDGYTANFGSVSSANGREFTGAATGFTGTPPAAATGSMAGSFFQGGADVAKAAAGAFKVNGTNYQAVGTIVSQR